MYYSAQFFMSAVVIAACTMLVTLGRLLAPVIIAVFLVSLLTSFLVTAKLLFETEETNVRIRWLILATLIGLGVGWGAAPLLVTQYSLYRMKVESFRNLEFIRDSITLYKVMTGGIPPFLVGGAAVGKSETAPDPLIGKGVITSYPVNPYGVSGKVVTYPVDFLARLILSDKRPCFVGADFLHNLQEELGDPISMTKGQLSRFGIGTQSKQLLVGNLLADARFKPTKFGYKAWGGGGIGKRNLPWIPGMFFYKTWRDEGGSVTHYILGLYGTFYDKGYDILGPTVKGAPLASDPSGAGCPFRIDENGKLTIGNPDGKPDGIVYALTDEGQWTPEGIIHQEGGRFMTPDELRKWREEQEAAAEAHQTGQEGDDGEDSGTGNDTESIDSPLIK
jgi:hypothetical protein